MEDVVNERKYAQTISEMDATDFFLLELAGMSVDDRIRHLNGATPELRAALRTKGEINLAVTDPKKALKNKGYSDGEIKAILDTYERLTNEIDMYGLQVQTAQKAEEKPILTTIGTYPAKLVGDVSGDITALASNIASDWGLSTYSTMDVNHPGFQASEYASTARDTVSSDLSGSAKVAYEVGNDTVDDLVKDEIGKLVGIPWLAVSGVYGERARKASEYGGSAERSNAIGLAGLGVAGITEAALGLLGEPANFTEKMQAEGVGLATQYAIDQVVQSAVNEQPEYTWRVERLMREGMDREKAEEQAIFQMLVERIG